MDVKDIITNLNMSEDDLKIGTKIYKAKCEVCNDSFGYILIEPTNEVGAENIVVKKGFEKPKPKDPVMCLCCGTYYDHAMDLFVELIYKKEK